MKKGIAVGIILLFIVSAVSPMVIGFDIEISKKVEPESTTSSGPMDSAWPMYGHDARHTGRSPYSTEDNPGDEKWLYWIKTQGIYGGITINDDGTIYFGALGFFALNPNGTLKWKYDKTGAVRGCSAVDENGIIYFGTIGYLSNLYAIYSNNGTLKWKYKTGNDIWSSPAIGEDGTIYFGDESKHIYALWPNGTLRWRYKTDHVVYSSPAIGPDGTVYCGSHDTYLYAFYPNNGTLKWRYKTGHWIRVSPCIADDGAIYVVSLDNYLHAIYPNGTMKWKTNMGNAGTSPTIGQDGTIYAGYTKLFAINPTNGSVKWIFDPGPGRTIRGATPCNSIDGTIYFGTSDGGEIIAVNPDGTEHWRKHIGSTVESAPAIGENGTVYIGSIWTNGGYLHAFGRGELEADADGPHYGLINEPVQFSGSATGGYPPYSWYWNFGEGNTSVEQNPTHTYTTSGNYTVTLTVNDNSGNTSDDTTWASIQASNDPPYKPDIDGETNGKAGVEYDYTFVAIDPDGNDVWYHISWGDKEIIYIYGPYDSGEEITLSYTWSERGTYNISCKARDVYDEESDWAYLEVTMPKNQNMQYGWFSRFPLLQGLLSLPFLNRLLFH